MYRYSYRGRRRNGEVETNIPIKKCTDCPFCSIPVDKNGYIKTGAWRCNIKEIVIAEESNDEMYKMQKPDWCSLQMIDSHH